MYTSVHSSSLNLSALCSLACDLIKVICFVCACGVADVYRLDRVLGSQVLVGERVAMAVATMCVCGRGVCVYMYARVSLSVCSCVHVYAYCCSYVAYQTLALLIQTTLR